MWQTLMLSRWRPALAWLPIETVIRDRQPGHYAVFAESNAEVTCSTFVRFMLEVIRDALAPYAAGGSDESVAERRALDYSHENPKGTISGLAEALGMPQRSTERLVAEPKEEGRLVRDGSARSGTWRVAS